MDKLNIQQQRQKIASMIEKNKTGIDMEVKYIKLEVKNFAILFNG